QCGYRPCPVPESRFEMGNNRAVERRDRFGCFKRTDFGKYRLLYENNFQYVVRLTHPFIDWVFNPVVKCWKYTQQGLGVCREQRELDGGVEVEHAGEPCYACQ